MRRRRLAQIALAAASLQRSAVLADDGLLRGLGKATEEVDLTKALDKVASNTALPEDLDRVAQDAIRSTEDLAKSEQVKRLAADVRREEEQADSGLAGGAVALAAANATAGSAEPAEGLTVDAPTGGAGGYSHLPSVVLIAGLLVGLLYFRERHKKQRTVHLAGDPGEYVSGGYIGSDDYYSSSADEVYQNMDLHSQIRDMCG